MGIFEAINKISGKKVIAYLLTASAMIVPGIGYLYIKYSYGLFDLFVSLDTFKLILLSVLFSLPIFIFSLFFTAIDNTADKAIDKGNSKDEIIFTWLIEASWLALLSFYGTIFLYLYQGKLKTIASKDTLLFVYVLSIVLQLGAFIFVNSIMPRLVNVRKCGVLSILRVFNAIQKVTLVKVITATILTVLTYILAGTFVNDLFSLIHNSVYVQNIIVFALWLLILIKLKK